MLNHQIEDKTHHKNLNSRQYSIDFKCLDPRHSVCKQKMSIHHSKHKIHAAEPASYMCTCLLDINDVIYNNNKAEFYRLKRVK